MGIPILVRWYLLLNQAPGCSAPDLASALVSQGRYKTSKSGNHRCMWYCCIKVNIPTLNSSGHGMKFLLLCCMSMSQSSSKMKTFEDNNLLLKRQSFSFYIKPHQILKYLFLSYISIGRSIRHSKWNHKDRVDQFHRREIIIFCRVQMQHKSDSMSYFLTLYAWNFSEGT